MNVKTKIKALKGGNKQRRKEEREELEEGSESYLRELEKSWSMEREMNVKQEGNLRRKEDQKN